MGKSVNFDKVKTNARRLSPVKKGKQGIIQSRLEIIQFNGSYQISFRDLSLISVLRMCTLVWSGLLQLLHFFIYSLQHSNTHTHTHTPQIYKK